MNVNYYFPRIIISFSALCFYSCEHKPTASAVQYTRLDSLTETYLDLKDNMLETWNAMINDDNQKIKAMHNVIHELLISDPSQKENLNAYQQRLDKLVQSRYTQKSMADTQVVEEYDFVSNSLVSELISLAESQKQFTYNPTLQKLVESIRMADQRVNNYREDYDSIATAFNRFIEENKVALKEIDEDSFLEKKPLFQMVAEDN